MLTFHHAPMSRSVSIHWLLEELGVPYEIAEVDIRAEGGAPESYRAIHPHKKVPAIVHDGVVVTERAAIAIYLADAFPDAGLAPPVGDPRRAAYLHWLVYTDAVIDPGIVAHAQGWTAPAIGVSYGLFDDMLRHIDETVSSRPFAAGETFTAADTQLAMAIHYGMRIVRQIPERPSFAAYLARTTDRPGIRRAMGMG